ncbi:hypothetical protein [Kitasatospora paranensis]|uniref:hypothetical protein n=1 Tax=Kitasatospora paranensis TaxID=258053 RepID=UPI0031E8898E
MTIAALGYSLTQQTARDLLITAAVLLAGIGYWFAYLRPRSATHWVLSLPADVQEADNDDAATAAPLNGARL